MLLSSVSAEYEIETDLGHKQYAGCIANKNCGRQKDETDEIRNRDDVCQDFNDHSDYRPGVIFVLLISTVLVWGSFRLIDPETLPIHHVRIEGDFQQLAPEILQEIVVNVIKGGFFNINVDTIQQALLQDPWVHHVAVRRIWPDRLTVYVKEQVPVARWGEDGLLNNEAEYFKPGKNTIPENLPYLHGPEASYALLLNHLFELQGILGNKPLSIAALTLSERRAWQFKLKNGPVVLLGREDVMSRAERFAGYVPLQLADRLDQIESIDMRYTNGFAVRWKNGPVTVESRQENHGEKI